MDATSELTGVGEVALFIDFDNIRHGLRKYGQEPAVQSFVEKAKTHGTLAAAFAYADFNEHPDWVRRHLEIGGVTVRDVPSRRFLANGVERVRAPSDMHLVMDALETAIDRPGVHTYVLMTGDPDYIRLVTMLRHRFSKRVVISGVPGTVSSDLLLAAGSEEDPIEVAQPDPNIQLDDVIDAIVAMVHTKSAPLGFWTVRLILDWARDRRNAIPAGEPLTSTAVTHMVQDGILVREVAERGGREITVARLNYDHPRVQSVTEHLQPVDIQVPPAVQPVRPRYSGFGEYRYP